MSYTRSYSKIITEKYELDVSISYPASQSGGTIEKTFKGSIDVPINIDINVDTDMFDRNVNNCRNSVTGLNAMVVATSLAEVEAKKRTSNQVGQSIVGGFFNYISSELSQQSQELSSRCDSLIVALKEQMTACIEKSDQMGTDYKRISSRYTKLFTDLDNELSTRLKAIDKPIFKLNGDLLECSSRTTDTSLLGVATIAAAEASRLESLLSATMIKQRAIELMRKTNNFLKSSYYLENSLSSMLSDSEEIGHIMLPLIYLEAGEQQHSIKREVFGTEAMALNRVEGIALNAESRFQAPELNWHQMPTEQRENIDSFFNGEMSQSGLDARVMQMIVKLKGGNEPKTL